MTQRKVIRHAIRDMLATIPDLANRVHASRTVPINGDKPAETPCVLVYTDRDPADKVNSYTTKRSLALRIVVIVRTGTEADDKLDDLCEAIEQKMEQAVSGELFPEPLLASLVDSCDYVDTALTYTGDEGRAELVHAEMTYTAAYYRTPAQNFPDFATGVVEIDMANPRNDPQTESGPDGQTDAAVSITLNQ